MTAKLSRNQNLSTADQGARANVLFVADDTAFDDIEMGIADDAISIVLDMLSDISANRGAYALREAYSNAYDATQATGDMSLPIEITIPETAASDGVIGKVLDGRGSRVNSAVNVTVEDHGCGMTRDDVCRFFLQYGGSKKRGDAESIGSKGLGSKAPLAVADTFTVESTKDGVTTTAYISREGRSTNRAKVRSEYTGRDSGTKVTIPVCDAAVLAEMRVFAESLLDSNIDANILVNGKSASAALSTEVGGIGTMDDKANGICGRYINVGSISLPTDSGDIELRVWEPYNKDNPYDDNGFPVKNPYSRGLVMNLCGVNYQLCADANSYRYGPRNAPIIVEGKPGFLNFIPSRDAVKQDSALDDFVSTVRKEIANIDYAPVVENLFRSYGVSEMLGWLRDDNRYFVGSGNGTVTFKKYGESDITISVDCLSHSGVDFSPIFIGNGISIRAIETEISKNGASKTYRVTGNTKGFSGQYAKQVSKKEIAEHPGTIGSGTLRDVIVKCYRHSDRSVAIIKDATDATIAAAAKLDADYRAAIGNSTGVIYIFIDGSDIPTYLVPVCKRFDSCNVFTPAEFESKVAEYKREKARSAKSSSAAPKALSISIKDINLGNLVVELEDNSVITGSCYTNRLSDIAVRVEANPQAYAVAIGSLDMTFVRNMLAPVASMLRGTAAMPNSAKYLVICTKLTNKQIDALVSAGVTIFADFRNNVKNKVDTVLDWVLENGGSMGEDNSYHRNGCRYNLKITPEMAVGIEDDSLVRAAIINWKPYAIRPAYAAALACDTDALTDKARELIYDPIMFTLAESDILVRNARYRADEWYPMMRTRPSGSKLVVPHSLQWGIAFNGKLAKRVERCEAAIEKMSAFFETICSVTGASGFYGTNNSVIDENELQSVKTFLGSGIAAYMNREAETLK